MKIENYYLMLAIGKARTLTCYRCDVTFRSSSFSFYAAMKVAVAINSHHKQHPSDRHRQSGEINQRRREVFKLSQSTDHVLWPNASCYQASVWLTFQFPFSMDHQQVQVTFVCSPEHSTVM
jgi:hypothetical protein